MTTKYQWLITILVLSMLVFSFSFATALIIPVQEKPKSAENPADESEVDVVLIKHYAKGGNKPDKPGKGGTTCYGSFGSWSSTGVTYTINPANPDGLSSDFVVNTIKAAGETWDAEVGADLFNDNVVTTTNTAGTRDNENVISFGDYSQDGVIAVTMLWGKFWGKPSAREIYEFDLLFDTDFTWGDVDTDGTSVMDLLNIAVHEMGHTVGLEDMYDDTCIDVTMYGYSGYGETSKRTLEPDDIKGIESLYGA